MGYLSFPHKTEIMRTVVSKMQILIHFPEFNATLCKYHILICIVSMLGTGCLQWRKQA